MSSKPGEAVDVNSFFIARRLALYMQSCVNGTHAYSWAINAVVDDLATNLGELRDALEIAKLKSGYSVPIEFQAVIDLAENWKTKLEKLCLAGNGNTKLKKSREGTAKKADDTPKWDEQILVNLLALSPKPVSHSQQWDSLPESLQKVLIALSDQRERIPGKKLAVNVDCSEATLRQRCCKLKLYVDNPKKKGYALTDLGRAIIPRN